MKVATNHTDDTNKEEGDSISNQTFVEFARFPVIPGKAAEETAQPVRVAGNETHYRRFAMKKAAGIGAGLDALLHEPARERAAEETAQPENQRRERV